MVMKLSLENETGWKPMRPMDQFRDTKTVQITSDWKAVCVGDVAINTAGDRNA